MKKTILISIDGMRADGLLQCGNPYLSELKNISILDIAPTIADVMGITPPREWEGKSILKL